MASTLPSAALSVDDKIRTLILKLYEINAFKFGDYKLKVGVNSPLYFDLRVVVSYPRVMRDVCNLIATYIKEQQFDTEHICGVPYMALPLATILSLELDTPMLLRRKEIKRYGTKKLIEGIYNSGDTCLIIDDVICSGASILDTVRDLEREGVLVTDALVVVDKEQGGAANLAKRSVRLHALFKLSDLMNILREEGKIETNTVESVKKFIASAQVNYDGSLVNDSQKIVKDFIRTRIPLESRAHFAKSDIARQLFNIMATKKTNLCLAADLRHTADILLAAEQCGPYICILKTHVDIVQDFDWNFIDSLQHLALKHNFLLMEDRKFSEIGKIVALQYGRGLYGIAKWADLVTAHALPGRSVLQGLKASQSLCDEHADETECRKNIGVVLLGDMSVAGSLVSESYKEAVGRIATDGKHLDIIAGVVCQNTGYFGFPGLLQMTPGVKIPETSADLFDEMGQVYKTPEQVVQQGADIGIVGRGILNSSNIIETAALYRQRLWDAYMARIAKYRKRDTKE